MKRSASDKAVIRSLLRALDRALARDLNRDLDLHRLHDRDLDLARALDLARDLDLARSRTVELAIDLDGIGYRALDLDGALDLSRDLVGDLDRLGVLASELELDRDVNRDLNHASAIALDLYRAIGNARTISSEGRRVETARFAGRLVAAAARILPVMDQVRYGEEFRAELAEVARAGGGRWYQTAYAVRLLASAWSLRAELRDPQQRRALP